MHVTHLECPKCGARYNHREVVQTLYGKELFC